MLRSYAAAGVLVPAAVDASSGYRYYSTRQLDRARLVGLLKQAGVPVGDIAGFLAEPDGSELDRWERDIVTTSESRRRALAEARAKLASVGLPGSDQPARESKGIEMTNGLMTGAASHTGRREANEDSVLVSDGLFAVADGIGAPPFVDGEAASRLALDRLEADIAVDRTVSGVLGAYRSANQAVWQKAAGNADDSLMGSTLVAVAMTSDVGLAVFNVGDSRVYLFRNGRLSQLTDDHTVVADLLRAGELRDFHAAAAHPHRNVLTRAIGVSPDIEVDYRGLTAGADERLLLCTDGLWKTLSRDEMKAVLGSATEPQEAADRLVAVAVEQGAEDNVTAMVIDIR